MRSTTGARSRRPPTVAGAVRRLLAGIAPADAAEAAAFAAEGRRLGARGAVGMGRLAVALLLASAALSYLVGDAHAHRLLAIRLGSVVAIAAIVRHVRRSERHARPAALAIVLTLALTMEWLAFWTGGPASEQHDRLNLLVLGAAVLVAWPPAWVAGAALGVLAAFVLGSAASGGLVAGPPFVTHLGYLLASGTAAVVIGVLRERRRLDEFRARRAREAAARALAQQEERYRSVVETAGSAIVVISLENRILEFNAEAERISGRRREDVIGHDWVELLVPAHARASVRDAIRRLLAGEPAAAADGAVLRPDGTRRIVRWKNACLRDGAGRVVALLGAGQDVTESRCAARALERSEARLRRLVEGTQAIPWEAEGEPFRYTWVGPQAAALGWPAADWVRPGFREAHLHPDDRERVLRTSAALASRVAEFDLEYRLVTPDGRVVWLHDVVTVERDHGARPLLRGFAVDVTARKRLEDELEARVRERTAELRESEARVRSILEASPIAGGVVNDNDRLTETNPALHALLGCAPDGATLPSLVHPDDRARTLAALGELRARTADLRSVHVRFLRRDGGIVWTQTGLVATGSGVGPRRIFAMIQDVTARKREEALARGERRALRLLAQERGLEAALGALLGALEANDPEMICSVLVVDEAGRLRHGAAPRLDEEFRRAFDGIVLGEGHGTRGTNTYDDGPVVAADLERDPRWEPYRALVRARGLGACSWKPILSSTGSLLGTFALYSRTAHTPDAGELALLRAAARAAAVVIERQRLDDLIGRHRQELTHVGRLSLLAELAGGLAHEMQQPLASIVNYAGGCERMIREGGVDPAALLDAMGRIRGTALRAGQIIRGIRGLAQKREPRRERVDLNDVVRSAVQLLEGEARRQGVAVRLDLSAPLPAVLGDRIQLEQVVLNLIGNALDAVAGERRATVVVRTWAREAGGVAASVRDTGHGVSPEVAARMFEPFFTTKPLGLGLGLAIGRTIVEAHDGSMSVAAAAGGGTVVGFTLPAAASPGRDRREPASERPLAAAGGRSRARGGR